MKIAVTPSVLTLFLPFRSWQGEEPVLVRRGQPHPVREELLPRRSIIIIMIIMMMMIISSSSSSRSSSSSSSSSSSRSSRNIIIIVNVVIRFRLAAGIASTMGVEAWALAS